MSKGATLFFPARHKWLEEIVCMETPECARESVKKLREEFEKSKTRARKRKIYRAADLAAKRAKATLNREKLSAKEREEFREIAKIYRRFAEWCRRRLEEEG